jgi:hypothetical protein
MIYGAVTGDLIGVPEGMGDDIVEVRHPDVITKARQREDAQHNTESTQRGHR